VSDVDHIETAHTDDGLPPLAVQTEEEHRWLAWIGTPMAVAAGFMALAFGTGHAWILTFTVVIVILDILVLLMLVLTTDTNSRPGEPAAAGHSG
jgi:hypothetical protein